MLHSSLKITSLIVSLGLTTFFSLATSTAQADAEIEKGKTVYNGAGACATCHGALGQGDGMAAAALNPKPKNFAKAEFAIDADGDGTPGSANDIFLVITNGAAKYSGSPLMAGRADLSEEDRKALAKYVLSLKQ